MSVLNEKNDLTVKRIHLMITDKCNRDCKYCCNKQYNVYKDVPVVTNEELAATEIVYLTGGEPFAYANPDKTALELKREFSNIKKVFVYTNAYELLIYLLKGGYIYNIDGLTISLKDKRDTESFYMLQKIISIRLIMDNIWVYVFKSAHFNINDVNNLPFTFMNRDWQEDFRPEPNSIFRRISAFM